ncbi:MAG: 30S ribosomal protein S3ae [Candidatus Odinarchaeota archaeon]|nr:30S ribosomal protein S3ae [Candidatus Odinarchaeota archaeon]RLI64427.1 MAG: 30S ribosomal protein S3ae [Candidatus Asgardarchaeum californiense]
MPRGRRPSAVRDKWKSKKWYTVYAPKYFGFAEIGETPASSPDKLIGRVIETTLYNLTNDFSQAHILLYFQIVDVKGEKAYTVFKGHTLLRDYLRSLIRRGTTYVDGIFKVTTKDNHVLRVYSSAFTRYRIKTSREKDIRKVMSEIIHNKAKELTFEQFVQEAVLGKIASEIYNKAKVIAPIRRCEIRKTKVLYIPPEVLSTAAPEIKTVAQKEQSEKAETVSK